MESVVISSQTYDSYASLEQFVEYMFAVIGPTGDAARAASDDNIGRALVSATRQIDLIAWGDGVTDDADWQAAAVTACIELAAAMLAGTVSPQEVTSTTQKKRLRAGSAEIEYFKSSTSAGATSKYPPAFLSIFAPWWPSSSSSMAPSQSFGTCRPSIFDTEYE